MGYPEINFTVNITIEKPCGDINNVKEYKDELCICLINTAQRQLQ